MDRVLDRVVVFAGGLLLSIQAGVELVDSRAVRVRVPAECDADHLQEAVHPVPHRERTFAHAGPARIAGEDHDAVRHHVDEVHVVIDDEPGARFLLHDPSDRPRGLHPLVRIEISGRLVDQIDVRIPAETQGDGDALQLAAGQRRNVPLEHSFDLERLEDLRLEVAGIRLLSDGVAKQFADLPS